MRCEIAGGMSAGEGDDDVLAFAEDPPAAEADAAKPLAGGEANPPNAGGAAAAAAAGGDGDGLLEFGEEPEPADNNRPPRAVQPEVVRARRRSAALRCV